MKKILFATVLLSFLTTTIVSSVGATSYGRRSSDIEALRGILVRDPVVPWPWGKEMPFPWTFVQGVWMAESADFSTYFYFRVIRAAGGLNQLEVTQVDPASCDRLATGVGAEQDRTVRALMQRTQGSPYRIILRSFDEKQIQGNVGAKPFNGQYMVLTVVPFDGDPVSVPMQFMGRSLTKCRVIE